MALTKATISGPILGPDGETRLNVKVTIRAVAVNGTVKSTEPGGAVLAGEKTAQSANDGTLSVTLPLLPQANVAPAEARWRATFTLLDFQNRRGSKPETLAPIEFELSGATTWAALVDVSGVPVTESLLALVNAARDGAVAAAEDAEAAKVAAQAVGTTNDAVIAGRVNDPASATTTALKSAAAARDAAPTLGKALKAATTTGSTLTVALTGHSLLYGQDTSGTGTQPGVNGAGQTRNPNALSLLLPGLLNTMHGKNPTIVHQGYPGDETADAITRWSAGSSGDVEVFWLDTNDPGVFGTPPLTPAQSAANLGTLIERAHARGASVIVMGGAPVADNANHRQVRVYTKAQQQVAARYGATFLDVGQLLRGLRTAEVWTDGVHLTGNAYGIIGARLACILGAHGDTLPHAAPGSQWLPGTHGEYGSGVIVTRTNSIDGRVIRLTAGQSAVIPFNIIEPSRTLIDFNTDGNGTGTGKVLYAFGAAGENPISLNINAAAGTGVVPVRGHDFRSAGPDAVIVTCDTGTLEIERVRFVGATSELAHTSDTVATGARVWPSTLGGQVVTTKGAATYSSLADEQTPVTTLGPLGTTYKADADFLVRLPSSGFCGVGLMSSLNKGDELMRGTGYMVTRSGTDLVVKNASDLSNVVSVGAVFPAGVTFDGLVTMRLDGNDLLIYTDGTLRHTVTGATWRNYVPIAFTQGTPVHVLACTVRRY